MKLQEGGRGITRPTCNVALVRPVGDAE